MKLILLAVTVALVLQAPSGGENRQLVPTSKYKGLATDGSDLGAHADFVTIQACAVHGMDAPECQDEQPVAPRAPFGLKVSEP
jgi:hypothetical protein